MPLLWNFGRFTIPWHDKDTKTVGWGRFQRKIQLSSRDLVIVVPHLRHRGRRSRRWGLAWLTRWTVPRWAGGHRSPPDTSVPQPGVRDRGQNTDHGTHLTQPRNDQPSTAGNHGLRGRTKEEAGPAQADTEGLRKLRYSWDSLSAPFSYSLQIRVSFWLTDALPCLRNALFYHWLKVSLSCQHCDLWNHITIKISSVSDGYLLPSSIIDFKPL